MDSPSENVYAFASLTWRKVNAFHKEVGSRSLRFRNFTCTALQPVTLFNALYGSRTIDRIIGCKLNFGQTGAPASVTVTDLGSGFVWPITASGHLGNYNFNIETGTDGANIQIVSTLTITAQMNAYIALYNFELPESSMGASS